MNGSIEAIVTLGFGTYATVNHIVTLGYGTSIAIAPTVPGIEWAVPGDRLHWEVPEE